MQNSGYKLLKTLYDALLRRKWEAQEEETGRSELPDFLSGTIVRSLRKKYSCNDVLPSPSFSHSPAYSCCGTFIDTVY